MKVNSDVPLTPADFQRLDADPSTASSRRSPAPAAATDSVAISGDVQLANAAVRAAQNSPDVRSDAVARAKALLDRGQVGNDLNSLASTIVDSLIK